MTTIRVAKTSAAVLTHCFEVGETLTDSSTLPTVAVTDATGASVSSGNATHTTPGTYTYTLPGQSQLGWLTAAWAGTIASAAVVQSDPVEIVGGFFFSLATGRGSDSSLSDTSKYPTADLELARLEVEQECEAITDRAFVPRYLRMTLDGTGESDLVLAHPDPDRTVSGVRTIRSVKMAPRADGTFVSFTAGELAALKVADDGTLRRLDGRTFTEGFANIIIELEYGLDAPPADLVRACLTRFRSRLNINKSAIPTNATSYSTVEGGTYRLDIPGPGKTGLPHVDAVYARYSLRSGVGPGGTGRALPAARTLNYDPQRTSLFHGGRR
jgi:hypothetical protein